MTDEPTTGWYPDPAERFEERFLLRGVWSSLVRDSEDEEGIDHPSPDLALPPHLVMAIAAGGPTDRAAQFDHSPGIATATGPAVAPIGSALLPPPAPGTHQGDLLAPAPHQADSLSTALLPSPPPMKSSGRWSKLGIRGSKDSTPQSRAEPGHASTRGLASTLRSLRFVLVVLVVGAGAVVTYRFSERGPTWPKAWDPRVAQLVTFVEQERNLNFEHPVLVSFMAEKDFDAEILARRTDGADDERQANSLAVLRAMGLVTGAPDADKVTKDLSSVIVGYYDFATSGIKVRGTVVSPEIKLTLAHELTHALQDQNFKLAKLQSQSVDDSAGFALLGLIEGDAQRTALAYFETLNEAEQQEVIDIEGAQIEKSTVDQAPPALQLVQAAPYELGQLMVSAFAANSGGDTTTIDHAFEVPPKSDLALVDPVAYLLGNDVRDVEPPDLADDEDEIEVSPVGALGWYLMVASRFEPARALSFVHDWRGDASVSYKRADDTVCLRATLRGADGAALGRMVATLQDWASGVASGGIARPEVVTGVDTVTLTTCDPGASAPAPPNSLTVQYTALALRNRVAVQLMIDQPKAELSAASCLGDAYIARFGVTRLTSDELFTPEEQLVSHELLTTCVGAEIAGPPPTTLPTVPTPASSSSRANP
jgi:hypothetical protein